ncbi:MAG TPA: dTDP-4-dehydrorhamnose 3,5-epimerase family protein [Acidobacteriota bacterium]|nr:dTDP-4-dehydrorhamnose 3,5-epimerase family protein [Acidobacteriota bacterium]
MNEVLPLGERCGLKLSVIKQQNHAVGTVINRLDDGRLIQGVRLEAGVLYPDDRGYFTELFRIGVSPLTEGLANCPTLQLSMAVTYPGVIKAFHYHFEQTDVWAPVRGTFQVVLCDLREGSSTHGQINTLYAGHLRPWRLRIPPGVGHGYKVVGLEEGTLFYATDRFYNPSDEGRLAYDHPWLNYDWDVQYR